MRKTKNSKSKNKDSKHKTKPVKKQRKRKESENQSQEKIVQEGTFPFSLQDQGLIMKINLHKEYRVKKQSDICIKLKNFFVLYEGKEKRKNKKLFDKINFSYYPHFEFDLAGENPQQQKCSICQFQYENLDSEGQQKQLISESEQDLIVLKCSHTMHYGCFKMLLGEKQWIRCPVCSTIFGKMIGDQPPGIMNWNVDNFSHCDTHLDCGTISITYQMHAGKKGDVSFPATYRHAYLPDNQGGRQVLKLLKQAFDRKLIFTVGRSVTTGRDNQIVWNGIHHKTNLSGGSAYFGYPDPTYFDRVKLELAAKGIY